MDLLETKTELNWADSYGIYFFASIGFWFLNGIRIWFLPLPHLFIINSARVWFSIIVSFLGLTTFMARSIYRYDSKGSYDSIDWLYVDNSAQCLVGLQVLLWSVVGKTIWLGLFWIPLVISVFYPILVFTEPITSTIFMSSLPLLILAGLSVVEIRGRNRQLIFGWLVSVTHAILIFVFNSSDLGKSFIRFLEVFLLIFWFDFWIQIEQEYMECGCPCISVPENGPENVV